MSSLRTLNHTTPAYRTFAGDRALDALPKELARVGSSRVVLVGGPWLPHTPEAVARIEEALGERLVARFDDVVEHSPVPAVEKARDLLADTDADAIVVVGGGSSIVTARAASILLAEKRDVRELCTREGADGRLVSPRLSAPKLPNWVIPTTPITAYAKAGSAVHDPETGERLALFDPKTRAQGIFLDPVIASTAPVALARSSALNAFSMAVECLQAGVDDPLADALLIHSLTMLAEWLPQLAGAPDDPEPRLRLMLAALLCGQGSDFVGGGLAQAISHAAGPRSTASNGTVEAMLLPHTMLFNAPVTGDRLAVIATVLGGRDDLGAGEDPERRAVVTVDSLLAELGVPSLLRDVGITEDTIPQIVEAALGDFSITRVPRPVDAADLTELLRVAL